MKKIYKFIIGIFLSFLLIIVINNNIIHENNIVIDNVIKYNNNDKIEYVIVTKNKSQYHVYSDNLEVFKKKPIKIGKEYKVFTKGLNVQILGIYPKVISIVPLEYDDRK